MFPREVCVTEKRTDVKESQHPLINYPGVVQKGQISYQVDVFDMICIDH